MFKFKSVSTWFKFKCGMIVDSRSWVHEDLNSTRWTMMVCNQQASTFSATAHVERMHPSLTTSQSSPSSSRVNRILMNIEKYQPSMVKWKWHEMTQNYLLSSTILYPQNGSFFIPTMINFINSCEAIGLRLVSNVSIFPMAHPYGTDLWVLQQKPPRLHAAWRSLHNARCYFLRWPSGDGVGKGRLNANITNNLQHITNNPNVM